MLLTAIQAGAYILSGMYGTLSTLGIAAIVIFFQLIAAGLIVMLLDELVQKGWGLGSGISLFIMAGVAQNVLWSTFSPSTGLFVGALTQLFAKPTAGQSPFTLLDWIVGTTAGTYPSFVGFIATIGAFLDNYLFERFSHRVAYVLRWVQGLPK